MWYIPRAVLVNTVAWTPQSPAILKLDDALTSPFYIQKRNESSTSTQNPHQQLR